MVKRTELALERFKQSRAEGGSPAPEDRPAPAPEIPATIAYTRTRPVDVPVSLLRDRRVLSASEPGAYADAYKILRTQVMHRMRENGWSVLAVTSPGEREGKTLTAINLSISVGMDSNQTVLLVDADLRNPSIHEVFGLEADRGLVNYLLDNVAVEDLLVHPGIQRLVLLPAGPRIQNSVDVLTLPKMIALVDELKRRYQSRVVIFDLPPILQAADVLAFAPYVDAALIVVEAGRTTVESLERALLLLKGATPVIGTVFNKAGRAVSTEAS